MEEVEILFPKWPVGTLLCPKPEKVDKPVEKPSTDLLPENWPLQVPALIILSSKNPEPELPEDWKPVITTKLQKILDELERRNTEFRIKNPQSYTGPYSLFPEEK